MCAGRVGDFAAIGYPGSFSLNFSLRSALLLEEKERCEEVTEEMEHAKKTISQLRNAHGKKLRDVVLEAKITAVKFFSLYEDF